MRGGVVGRAAVVARDEIIEAAERLELHPRPKQTDIETTHSRRSRNKNFYQPRSEN